MGSKVKTEDFRAALRAVEEAHSRGLAVIFEVESFTATTFTVEELPQPQEPRVSVTLAAAPGEGSTIRVTAVLPPTTNRAGVHRLLQLLRSVVLSAVDAFTLASMLQYYLRSLYGWRSTRVEVEEDVESDALTVTVMLR